MLLDSSHNLTLILGTLDLPYQPGYNNSLDVEDCLYGVYYVDDQLDAAKQTKVSK